MSNLTETTTTAKSADGYVLLNPVDQSVLEVVRLHGGVVNIDEVKDGAKIEYGQALESLLRLERRGDIVRGFYKTRFALIGL